MRTAHELLTELRTDVARIGKIYMGELELTIRKSMESLVKDITICNKTGVMKLRDDIRITHKLLSGLFNDDLEVMQWIRQLEILEKIADEYLKVAKLP